MVVCLYLDLILGCSLQHLVTLIFEVLNTACTLDPARI